MTRVLSQFFEKHGENFTQFQLRIWSEIFVSGIYGSLYTPPNSSMFIRAGGGNRSKKVTLSGAITQLSEAISSLTPKSPPPLSPVTVCSSVKSIDGRTKCYKQLGEVNDLKQSEQEFNKQ